MQSFKKCRRYLNTRSHPSRTCRDLKQVQPNVTSGKAVNTFNLFISLNTNKLKVWCTFNLAFFKDTYAICSFGAFTAVWSFNHWTTEGPKVWQAQSWLKKLNSWPQEKQWVLLYIPAQIGFPIGGDRVTCGWWKLAMVSSYGEQNSLIPKGNNNLNFRLVRDQLVILETAADL